ncbi:hypothetical protein [Haladaptatus sp. NG-SE-30]
MTDRPAEGADRATNEDHEHGDHSDEYNCPACKKVFDSRDDLVKHMREQGLVD